MEQDDNLSDEIVITLTSIVAIPSLAILFATATSASIDWGSLLYFVLVGSIISATLLIILVDIFETVLTIVGWYEPRNR